MLTRVSLDPDRHQKLPEVSLRVFGGMEQKTEYRGRKAPAPHESGLRQYCFINGPKLVQRLLHLPMKRRNKISGRLSWD